MARFIRGLPGFAGHRAALAEAPTTGVRNPRLSLTALAALLLLGLMLLGPQPGGDRALATPRWLMAAWDMGHVVLFAVLGSLLGLATSRFRALIAPRQLLLLALLGLLFGGLLEALQWLLGQDASADDLRRDLVGVLLVAAFAWPGAGLPARARRTLRVLTLLLLALESRVLGLALVDEYRMARDFPVLAEFSAVGTGSRWSSGVRQRIADDRWVLQVPLTDERYSGSGLVHLIRDWRGYRTLVLRLRVFLPSPGSDGAVVHLMVRDRDTTARGAPFADRYNGELAVTSGRWTTLRIPLAAIRKAPSGRVLNLAEIADVTLFLVQPGGGAMQIERLWLE